MRLRSILLFLLLLVCQTLAAGQSPNIVFILADDLGVGDLASYGHPYAITPNLDRLANEGTRFDHYYNVAANCSQSRWSLLTGQRAARYSDAPSEMGLQDLPNVMRFLRSRGYRIGHFGKWHLGPRPAESPDGFGINEAEIIGAKRKHPDGRDAPVFESAMSFIRSNREQNFYVNIWGHISHFPVLEKTTDSRYSGLQVDPRAFPPRMQEKITRCQALGCDPGVAMGNYLDELSKLDRLVGRVLNLLDELGLAENTVVVFSSDNGPSDVRERKKSLIERIRLFNEPDADLNMMGSAGPYRGGKHTLYEGGIRAPFLVRWPRRVPAGHVNDQTLLSGLDWFPTLADISGYSHQEVDGESMLDVWLGANRKRSKPMIWHALDNGPVAYQENGWKILLRTTNPPELYKLSSDPIEQFNVFTPEGAQEREMMSFIRQWMTGLPENRQPDLIYH